MKKNYFKVDNKFGFLLILMVLLTGNSYLQAQVLVPFMQRTSQYTPNQKIYNVKGDFTMIGNTNLTLQDYGINIPNSNHVMQYVDIDGDATTFNSSSATLDFSRENGAIPSCSNVVFAGLYWTGRASNDSIASPNTFSVTKNGVTKTFDKRVISLKGPQASGYTQVTANTDDIYFPVTSNGYMYSAYAEVTDYVRANGVGDYTVADMALQEGNGGSTGFYGGWGLVVVYENSKMNYRDVTIFDGHAYVEGNVVADYQIPVSGFNTSQSGPVNVKLGLMSGEGDKNLNGDYFQIRNAANTGWISMRHATNTPNNFFNSSIETGGNVRNPNLSNNTGLDISMFNVPNPANSTIANNQTSTRFRYGTEQDTYVIFAVVMAVDAYKPDIEGIVSLDAINGVPVGNTTPSVMPGEDLSYKIEIRNRGTEPILNTRIVIPVPFNTTYVANSATKSVFFTPLPTPNNLYYDAAEGANGSVIWDLGTLPLPANSDLLLGELRFTFKVTEDCTLLKNLSCINTVALDGNMSGTGSITGVNFSNQSLILGYAASAECFGTEIQGPLNINLNSAAYVSNNCQDTPPVSDFVFCTPNATIPITAVSGAFAPGTLFYNIFPIVAGTTVQYTVNNPFPATAGVSNYFAVAPGFDGNCFFQFTINVNSETAVPATSDVQYCVGETAVPLVATPSVAGHIVYYYWSLTGIGQSSITPSTEAAGITTYYASEGESADCMGPKVPITVTINATVATFSEFETICAGAEAPILPLISNEGITGSWFPEFVSNTQSGEYVFTPDPGQCATETFSLNITVNQTTVTFDAIAAICDGAEAPILPLISNEGITGSWFPEFVSNTQSGEYVFTPDPGQCANNFTLDIAVVVTTIPTNLLADCNDDIDLKFLLQDLLLEGMPTNGTWTDIDNSGGIKGDFFVPFGLLIGSYDLNYTYFADGCTKVLVVTIDVRNNCVVLPSCTLRVFNAFSPNNDGVNEYFSIENLENFGCFPTNTVEIFNRWGVRVYETKQYDNALNSFKGISEGRVTIAKSTELPSGTYFYILNYTTSEGQAMRKDGYLYLSR